MIALFDALDKYHSAEIDFIRNRIVEPKDRERRATKEGAFFGGVSNSLTRIFSFDILPCPVIMKQYIEIICRYRGADDLVKNGRGENGMRRCRRSGCGRSFQREYTYNAWKPGVKEQIEKQTLNSSGIRDISRNLNISPNTVVSELKKNSGGSESVFYAAAGRSRD